MEELKLVEEVSARYGKEYTIWAGNLCCGVYRRLRPAKREFNRIKKKRVELGVMQTERTIMSYP